VRDEIVELLQKGGFKLSKWASNCPELLDHFTSRKGEAIIASHDKDSSVLGTHWDQSLDRFYFSYKNVENQGNVTKRTILSEAFRLFDPLGLLGPIILLAKLIMQELWQLNVHWDESIPSDIDSRWKKLKTQLPTVNQYTIPRCVRYNTEYRHMQLHGFCDASQRAYGACIYLRTQISSSEFRGELLCSRSRVAPIKSVSLPRLELSAALLLAQLIDKISKAIDLANTRIFLWSDSTIALNWISSSSRKWAVFVANRVGEIQRLTKIDSWHHISSAINPADILSRGLEPHELLKSHIWWHGPPFLTTPEDKWPSGIFKRLENVPESRNPTVALAIIEPTIVDNLIHKFSNLNKACRVLAYCLRFSKARRPNKPTVFISHAEILVALELMCKVVQKQAFFREYNHFLRVNQ